jgi:hypothetical protein
MNIRSSGIFGDERSHGGLFRPTNGTVANGVAPVNPTAPGDIISRAEVFGYFFDFTDETNELDLTNQWEAVDVGTMTLNPSTFIVIGGHGGILRLDSDATDGDGNWISLTLDQSLGYGVTPAAGRVITFEARVTHADWDTEHYFIGLIEDVGGSAGLDTNGDMLAGVEYVGFHYNDDDDTPTQAGIPRLILAGGNNTEVTTAPVDRNGQTVSIGAGTDSTFRRFGVRIIGTTGIEWYVDDKLVGVATAASAFTAPLYPGFGSVMNEATGDEMDIDYVLVTATR